jgi:hypothetical protein
MPDHFIHIEIRPRKRRIDLFLYGRPESFVGLTTVVVRPGTGAYCRCEITHACELGDVAQCVRIAWDNYSRR